MRKLIRRCDQWGQLVRESEKQGSCVIESFRYSRSNKHNRKQMVRRSPLTSKLPSLSTVSPSQITAHTRHRQTISDGVFLPPKLLNMVVCMVPSDLAIAPTPAKARSRIHILQLGDCGGSSFRFHSAVDQSSGKQRELMGCSIS